MKTSATTYQWVLPGAVLLLMFCVFPGTGRAQEQGQQDTTNVRQTSADTLGGTETRQEDQVDFQASDSLVFNFEDTRTATLYGSSEVSHTSGTMTAGKISLNFDRHLVSAATQTPEDTLSQPVLKREGERIRSHNIQFNYETEKGRFEVARVTVEKGKVTGQKVKNTGPDVVFIEDGIYSTCELDHPHYYLKFDRGKVVNEEEIFFTNARLYLLDIPYPLILPFGYVPAKLDRKRSGLLEPTYVIDNTLSRGIGLQNVGWFQYFNDYITGRASVDVYTSGTFFLDAGTNYRNRNRYNGRIQIGYSRERGLEPTDPNFSINSQKRLTIEHNQSFSPYASISANINLRTSDFYRRNSFDINERAQTSTNSSLNYQYNHPENLYKFSVSAQQNQNFKTNQVRLSGPLMNFSLRPVTPFSGEEATAGNETVPFYKKLTVRYQNEFRSNYTFNPIRGDSARVNWFEALVHPSKYREATGNSDHYEYAFRQDASISIPGILPSRFVNLTGNINYDEFWYPTTIRKSFDPATNTVKTRQVRGFTSAREFSTGLNMSTTFYGLMNRSIGNLQGFRHTVRPSLSFVYRPDFSDDFWGYYREVQTDTLGNVREYSIFENEVFRGPGQGEVQQLNFSLRNVFETKLVNRDSTGEINERTLRLIDQLDFSTGYNFAADSLNLSNLNASFSTRVVSNVSIRARGDFNFYRRDTLGRKINSFLWQESDRILEPVNWSVSASTTFPRDSRRSWSYTAQQNYHYPRRYDPLNQRVFHPFDPGFNETPVDPFSTPWSVSFNFSYQWRLNPTGENSKSATLNATSIQFRLTPKWSFQTRMGYDFIRKELTPSRFSLSRELHRWTLNFTMNPFGEFQFFAFSLRLNSPTIQGLFQKLPLLNNLERTSSPTGRQVPMFR